MAAEAVLIRYLSDNVSIDRILNMIELSTDRMLHSFVTGGNRGFDPSTKEPSVSNLQYAERARTAEEIKNTPGHMAGDQDPMASPQRQRQQSPNPNASSNRPDRAKMPWV